MKLNMGNLIKYDGAVYEVVAIIMSTLYLRAVDSDSYDYEVNNLSYTGTLSSWERKKFMIFNYTLEDLARAIAGLEEHEQNAIIGNNLINMQYLLKLMNDDDTCKDTIEKLDEGIEQLNNTIEQYERLESVYK